MYTLCVAITCVPCITKIDYMTGVNSTIPLILNIPAIFSRQFWLSSRFFPPTTMSFAQSGPLLHLYSTKIKLWVCKQVLYLVILSVCKLTNFECARPALHQQTGGPMSWTAWESAAALCHICMTSAGQFMTLSLCPSTSFFPETFKDVTHLIIPFSFSQSPSSSLSQVAEYKQQTG